ncbi:hypothetical protein LV564_11050 [Komagataeibacter nataicola]|uniref:Uncharacterized protein n=1 Tax=Komagataeibacter nataicola TaxID=265960 RepID=A0ABX5P9S3_9PROT|nr:hypothetical protein [Komagataeibacter nataicola]PYD66007.1 hypothetical protein CDI09_10405 [Komagataeibacter nataicola]WEQ54708.1 hypothetical protein LV564_11050 [Komagataeibacter nataicola]WNM09066.1 hypothetical protein RI056_03150 [Komagataeibacter nataicola]GBR20087.1 hypothetical protein AA0616_1703 [Komagataeibacter nataicola NRIC 0616]
MATSRGKLITALSAGLCLLSVTAMAAPASQDDTSSSSDQDRMTVHGQRGHLPPGYEEAPSMELNHGPDPDHLEHVHRDSVTGTDLSRFGTAYQSSGINGDGQLGDSTGNGWVAPR